MSLEPRENQQPPTGNPRIGTVNAAVSGKSNAVDLRGASRGAQIPDGASQLVVLNLHRNTCTLGTFYSVVHTRSLMTIIRTPQQSVALLVTAVLLFLNSGCMVNKVQKLTVSQVKQPNQEHLVGVTTKTGSDIGFDPPGGTINRDSIEAKVNNVSYSVAMQDVQRLWVERRGVSAPRTIGLDRKSVV